MKIRAEISYLDGNFNFIVKYLCFTIFPLKEKKQKVKKSKVKQKKNKSFDNEQANSQKALSESDDMPNENINDSIIENDDKNKTKSKESVSEKIDKLLEILEKVKIVWSVSKKHLTHIFKRIYIEEIMIDFIIADDDAYKAAMSYGAVNAAVFNVINFIRTFFTVTIKTVDIACDFDKKEVVYDFSAKITVKPSTILSAAFGILFGLLINIKKLIGTKKTKQPSDIQAAST